VLRPRARLEDQLATGAEVRGRTEGLGVVTLLKSVARQRPDARIVVRDAWNLFEADLRHGDLADLTRTATDGSFARGPRALIQLLGVTSARFTVDHSDGTVMRTFDEPLEQILNKGCAELGALVDAVSGKALPLAAKLELDPDALSSFLRTSPAPIERIVRRLEAGESPRSLLMSGDVAPGNLESALIDLARRGAIRSVRGVEGEDRVALALDERKTGRDIPTEPPIQPPEVRDSDLDSDSETPTELQTRTDSESATQSDSESRQSTQLEQSESAEPTAVDIRPPGALVGSSERASLPPNLDEPFDPEEPGKEPQEPQEPQEPEEPTVALPLTRRIEELTLIEPVETLDEMLLSEDDDEADALEAARLAPMASAVKSRPEPEARKEARVVEPSLLGWAAMLLLFGLAGFVAMSLVSRSCGAPADQADPDLYGVDDLDLEPLDEPDDEPDASRPSAPAPEELAFGETLPHVDAGPNLRVGRDQGVLVIEAGEGPAPEVFVGGVNLGRVPVRRAMDEGRYELRYRRGDEESYRFVYVRAGQTRVIPPL
jgi:hypothetical protein